MREHGFWDSSSIAALFVPEPFSELVKLQAKSSTPVVWWSTLVEVESAFSRLHRSGLLTGTERQVAASQLRAARRGWGEIMPAEDVRAIAVDLLDRYSLRAADALQLAAALKWCDRNPVSLKFVCQDLRLSEAAKLSGFEVIRF